MLSSSQIAGFFDDQYLEGMHQYHFLDCSSVTTAFGLVCPGLPSHSQTCLDLLQVPLLHLGPWLDQK